MASSSGPLYSDFIVKARGLALTHAYPFRDAMISAYSDYLTGSGAKKSYKDLDKLYAKILREMENSQAIERLLAVHLIYHRQHCNILRHIDTADPQLSPKNVAREISTMSHILVGFHLVRAHQGRDIRKPLDILYSHYSEYHDLCSNFRLVASPKVVLDFSSSSLSLPVLVPPSVISPSGGDTTHLGSKDESSEESLEMPPGVPPGNTIQGFQRSFSLCADASSRCFSACVPVVQGTRIRDSYFKTKSDSPNWQVRQPGMHPHSAQRN